MKLGRAIRSLQSCYSPHGAGFEAEPPGLAFRHERARGYYVDLRAKTGASSIELERLNPVELAQLALGEHEFYALGLKRDAGQFLRLAELLAERGDQGADGLRWIYQTTVPKYGLDSDWCSAMAQGEAASVFVRAHQLDGAAGFDTLASSSVAPLLSRASDLVVETRHGPGLEEAPSRPMSLILNGWIFALWGLYDVWVDLGDPAARALFDESAYALERMLPLYDTGSWSRYSVYPHPMRDLAKPFYHRLHAEQLEVMDELCETDAFGRMAARFRRYETSHSRRIRVAANKLVFAAVDGSVRSPRLISGARRSAGMTDEEGVAS